PRLERGELMHRDALALGRRLQRVELVTTVRRTDDADRLVSRGGEPEQDALGEGRPADQQDAHGNQLFRCSAKNAVMRFQESAAASGRYESRSSQKKPCGALA